MPRPPFATLRGESAIPTLLTLAVCAWFLAAGGAILADRAPGAQAVRPAPAPVVVCTAPLSVMPDMHETITVEAQRG